MRLLMPVVLLALVARLWLQTWQSFGGDQPRTLPLALIVLRDTPWDTGWMWQAAAGIAAWIALMFTGISRWAWLFAAAVATGATVGLNGDAVGPDGNDWRMMATHGLHVVVSVPALSGLTAAWQHIGGLGELLTPDGFVLVAKLVSFSAAGACGFYTWKVVRPMLDTHPDGPSQLRSMAGLELACGFVALALTSILTSLPTAHE